MVNYNSKLFSYSEIFNKLVNLNKINKLPPRIMFAGLDGIGKRTFALHLINYLLSINEKNKYFIQNLEVNTESKSYNLINNLSHPNFYYISKNKGKKNIEIDQIRKMIDFLNKSSFNNFKKIIFINGVEDLNANSSNALLKSLEESNLQNLFILTHDINKKILDTINSRCLIFKMNFNFDKSKNVISEFFSDDHYENLNNDFKSSIISPSFLINHIKFVIENKLNLNNFDVKDAIKFIIENKLYKKNDFIFNNFQCYIEIYFSKMYMTTKDYKYYDILLKFISENNLINKYSLDLDSFFIKFENKYLNI